MGNYILAAVDDMFFASKIRGAAVQKGAEVRFVRSADAAAEAARAESPSLVVADLHNQRCDPFALAELFKADEDLRAVPLLGFFSHVQTALRLRAEEAGFDRVLPRSLFTQRLPEIIESGIG